jgi:hypothetical protein
VVRLEHGQTPLKHENCIFLAWERERRLFLPESRAQHGVGRRRFRKRAKQQFRIRGKGLQLQWSKCAGGDWCRLDDLDVTEIDGFGVFVVWRAGDFGRTSAVLYAGRGALRQEIADCRRHPIMSNKNSDGLRITWARVDPRDVDGVAAYLYQQLRPLWGEVLRSAAAPRPVNLPLTA